LESPLTFRSSDRPTPSSADRLQLNIPARGETSNETLRDGNGGYLLYNRVVRNGANHGNVYNCVGLSSKTDLEFNRKTNSELSGKTHHEFNSQSDVKFDRKT
jgi:hypothetical protein